MTNSALPIIEEEEEEVREGPTGRCSGHCCRKINIDASPEALSWDWKIWATEGKNRFGDIHLLGPMLVYLGKSDVFPGRHAYACRNWDEESGNCMIYEHRPYMCWSYPNNRGCHEKECIAGFYKEKDDG